jgi:hypothetical protein
LSLTGKLIPKLPHILTITCHYTCIKLFNTHCSWKLSNCGLAALLTNLTSSTSDLEKSGDESIGNLFALNAKMTLQIFINSTMNEKTERDLHIFVIVLFLTATDRCDCKLIGDKWQEAPNTWI